LFDELDQAFEHLRLAGEVAVERRFGAVEPGARAAVVIFSPFGVSSIWARVCRICRRRSPGLVAIIVSLRRFWIFAQKL
jgi:hypothetical protein